MIRPIILLLVVFTLWVILSEYKRYKEGIKSQEEIDNETAREFALQAKAEATIRKVTNDAFENKLNDLEGERND